MKITAKTFVMALIASNTLGQGDSKIGVKAPDLQFPSIINFKDTSAKLSDFKSKVVVIDFWATWCAPCIESLPHLEKLQEKFSDDLQVITVTDDPEARIRKFLEKRDVNLPIVIDTKREAASHFPHNAIPHTVIIDKGGVIRAVTTSGELTEEVIRKVITNQPIHLKEVRPVMNFDPSKPLSGNENFTYQITVTPHQEGLNSFSNSTGGKGGYANRRIMVMNLSAKQLFEIAYQFSYLRTIVDIKDKNDYNWNKQICFDLIVPEDIGEQRFKIMQQQLDILYDYKANVEKRIRPVKVLKVIPGLKAKLNSSGGGEKLVAYSGQGLSMENSGSDELVNFLSVQLNKPVIDQTGLSGRYDLELTWYNEDPDRINPMLKELGLELYDDELLIEVLVISDK